MTRRLTDFVSRGPVELPPTRVPQGQQPPDSAALTLATLEDSRRRDALDLERLAKDAQDQLDDLEARIDTGTWRPRIYVGATEFAGAYTDDEGYYVRVEDVVTAMGWVRTSANVNPVSQSIAIGELPFADRMLDTVQFWPAKFEQARLLAAGVFGLLQPRVDRRIFVNDSAIVLTPTSWSFNIPIYFSFVAQYRINRLQINS